MTEPRWWSYFKRIAGTETGRVIAEAAQVSEPQVSRWKSGKNRPDAEALITFARHYGRPPVEAIVAAGYLSPDEVGAVVDVTRPIGDIANNELLREVQRRIESVEHYEQFFDILRKGGPLRIGPAAGATTMILQEADEEGAFSVALLLPPDHPVIDSRADRSLDPALPLPLTPETMEEHDDVTKEPPAASGEGEAPESKKTQGDDKVTPLRRPDQAPKPESPEDAKAARKRDPRFPAEDPDAE
ncbi:immunity repressor [Gordonia phage BENtherdunthat]|uniref:Immunity repressor n=1 Tax=Gordonia phage BENtherdunthat TaxID=2047830 RepID=A0A2H4PF15_9CAUD|nr:transcriptional regulator [Gordonia phage BENtherdunthat]ATW60824.1 immunity repressor [Gordonia phage BENtherdunthat]